MLKLLERAIDSADERLVILAPRASAAESFNHVEVDDRWYGALVRALQGMRGHVYLNDGALSKHQLSPGGLHQTAEDGRSWHLLNTNAIGQVTGCAWYLEHEPAVTSEDLRLRRSPLMQSIAWREKLLKAADTEIARARGEQLNYVEVGGWAITEESRVGNPAGLMLALAGYSLGRIRGGCLGTTTATVRHCSSAILRKIGGAPFRIDGTTIPSYYDPRYQCDMEILSFDSRKPSERYAGLIDRLSERLANVLVVARNDSAPTGAEVAVPAWSTMVPGRFQFIPSALAS